VNDPVEIADGTNPNDPSSYNNLNKGLVAYYPFNGNANDESGNGNHLTNLGAQLTGDRISLPNKAYSFNGTSSQWMYVNNLPEPTNNGFTWSCWIKPGTDQFATLRYILNRNNNNSDNQVSPHLTIRPQGIITFASYSMPYGHEGNLQYNNLATPQSEWTMDQWILVTATSDLDNTRRIFINGFLVSQNTSTDYGQTGLSTLNIGADRNPLAMDPSGQYYFHGVIDDIRIYNRALSNAEVGQLYQSESGNLDTDGDGLTDAWERGYGRYQIIPGSFTATQAKADAAQRGGAMATFTSSAEWQSYLAIYGPITTDVRIGLEATNTDPTGWAWVTGEAGTFRNWDSGQPNGGWGTGETTTVIYDNDSNPLNIWHDFPDNWSLGNFSYLLEFGYPTDPTRADTDGDGFNDSIESHYASDPNNVAVTPNTIRPAGRVVAWGYNDSGQINIPQSAQSGVVAIAVGISHSLALKSDGSVVGWGLNSNGQISIPQSAQSGVTAIAAGGLHSLALKLNGSVVGWGNNNYDQINIPQSAQSGVTAIAVGMFHSLALKSDGSVVG
jgi:hypothetical protein